MVQGSLAVLVALATGTAQAGNDDAGESLGGVRLGMTQAEVRGLLGAPTSRARKGQTWFWKGAELEVLFLPDAGLVPRVAGLEVSGKGAKRVPKTRRGIGVGSTAAALRAAYGTALHDDNGMYVVGRGDRALSFDVGRDGSVNAIYLGLSWD